MVKIVVLSDLHIVPEGETSHGIDTAEWLRLGVEAINRRHADADLCLLAGDLTDRGDPAAYARLARLLADLKVPVCLTLGNHDDRPAFLRQFGADHADAETGKVDLAVDAGGQRVILLDSSEPGMDGGRLTHAQHGWLSARLAEAADRPVIVVLHHHANPLHTQVDRIALEDGARLVETLRTHPDIRQVIAGHVHYASTGLWHGLPFTTLSGGHYSVTIPLRDAEAPVDRLLGPAQMAVVLSDAAQTLVHFDNYVDGHAVRAEA
jgi:3',5'-cyclic AMP phosphodiesterase CpdA